ncbi:cupin [Embleya scabrispora]|uniref:Cupin n=1 Tax=Embleya scabrispora TaxID=159449 RepID=A0A1T3NT01_9ACTN|nr:cupin domain-containing protein [Embleya scabrispora]OPC79875.1 cupin [Embleya scabrispora]
MTYVDLFQSAVRLAEVGGRIEVGERRMVGDAPGWQVAVFRVETDAELHADLWEMHPSSDEVVCVWSGGLRIVLRDAVGDGEGPPVALGPGGAFVVPRGRWHRLEADGPVEVMSIGVRTGTHLEPRADGVGVRG